MAKTKYIVFTADVQHVQSARLKQAITDCVNQKYEELYFLISSGGGNVFEGLSLAAYISALPMKTIMYNIGQIDSVATAIFASGKERIGSKNASFMFHGITMTLPAANYLESQLKEIYDGTVRSKKDIARAISTYSGIQLKDIESLMIDGGVILTAEQAKDRGFISSIVEPAIPSNADIINISNI
ncbi:MAG: ATP-dependent Clp protease proteolytic subunit [Candidatus Omnitrophica bacterium]|nr:ATP-dependent Clp protease proteolytic subunit [Candidatus Omnitrophota bacterium]